MQQSDNSGSDLVAGLRDGDTAMFDRAYERYRTRIYSFLLRLAGRRDVADDLAQETWIALARAAPSLRPDTDLRAWLFTVARNAFRSYRRWAVLDISRWASVGDVDLLGEATGSPQDVSAENARALGVVEVVLASLSASDREMLLLVGVEGMPHEEAARIVGITEAAARQRLRRARALLAERVGTATMDALSSKRQA